MRGTGATIRSESGAPPRRPGPPAEWAARRAWLVLAALWTAAFGVACRLGPVPAGAEDGSRVAAAIFGQTRHAFGSQLYMTADRYFHRGVSAVEDRALSANLFARLHEAVAPSGHRHLSGTDVREMLPWLWLSLKMDPTNVETHRVAAFWLVQELRRPDLARQVLQQAGRAGTFNYQVKLDLGRLALRTGDLNEARAAFGAALAFWPRRQNVDAELARFERADILMYMALLDEIDGRAADAEARLGEILAEFPNRPGVRERMEALRAGQSPAVPAATIWAEMIRRYNARMGGCHRDGCGDGDGHAGHDHSAAEARAAADGSGH